MVNTPARLLWTCMSTAKNLQTGNMTHSQESRVSSSQDFRLPEESRSSVSALVSRLNSSALGVDRITDNAKFRGDSAKMKDQKLQEPFPWMAGFCCLCQAAVGSRDVRHLENLLNMYLENVTPNVKDCYTKPNRAAKLKKSMNDTLIFFHLFYQDIKETLEHSFYLEKMTSLVSMFMDMEIKASLRGRESLKKVASRLTSSLHIFLDNSEEHMVDAILMTKFVHKNYREICHPVLLKLLCNVRYTSIMDDKHYIRCLLAFKLWKKLVPDAEERKRINQIAMERLSTPLLSTLMEKMKEIGNVLPRIPMTKKNITLFLMQSNFNLKNACQVFIKSYKEPPKVTFNQRLGVEIDKPLFFVNHSGDSSPRLTEKDEESDSSCSNNLMNDLEPKAPQVNRLNDLTPKEPNVVDSQEAPKIKKKKVKKSEKSIVSGSELPPQLSQWRCSCADCSVVSANCGSAKKNKKKGKKQKVVKCVGNKKKKKLLGSGETSGKQAKKLSKLKNKKKKKKRLANGGDHSQIKTKPGTPTQVEDRNQLKVTTSLTQTDESSQVIVRPSSPVVGEHNQIRVIMSGHLLPDSSLDEESKLGQLKQASSIQEERVISKDNKALPQAGESDQVASQSQGKKSDQLVEPSPQVEEPNLINIKKGPVHAEESDEIASNEVSSMAEESNVRKTKPNLHEVEGNIFKANGASLVDEELKLAKNTQSLNKSNNIIESKGKTASVHRNDSSEGKVVPASPQVDECNQSKSEPSTQLEESDLTNIKEAFVVIGNNDLMKFKQALLQIGEYDENKVQKIMEQFEASERMRIRQAMYQFTDCDDKMVEAKIEPQLEIPKTEKCDSPGGPVQDSDLLTKSMEPPVKTVKMEIVNTVNVDSFDSLSNETSEAICNVPDITSSPSEKTADFAVSHSLSKDSILAPNEVDPKCLQSEPAECTLDNSRQDLFTVDANKDPLSDKALESPVTTIPTISEEGKPSDLSQKSKTPENTTPVPDYAVVELCDSSLKQEICDNSETAENETLDVSKSVQMDSYSDVEIVDEFKPRESGKGDATASEEEIVLGDDGDLLPRQANLDNIFATGNEDLVNEILGCSARQYPMSTGVLSVESMEFETDNPHVNDDLVPEPPSIISGYENSIVDNYYSKTIKDDNPTLYNSGSLYRIDEWMHYDRNNVMKPYELDRPILPSVWMEEEEDDDVTESDLSKSFESTPKRGMGKMSYHDAVMSYSRQKELRAMSGRHNSQSCLMTNSSESGSASAEASPLLTSSASGSSSPRSESAIDIVEGVAQESMDNCDNVLKNSELGVSCEHVPDVSSMRYYHSNYPKSPDRASCTKDMGYNAQVNLTSKIGSHHMDSARVVVERSLLAQAINDRLAASSSRSETSSKRSMNEASSQHSPAKRKKSSKMHPEQSVDSRTSAKQETREAGNYAAQSRATRGRRRRGRPPSRGRGVTSSCKLSSDSKSSRKHGYSGKGRHDPAFQISSSKKSQQYDPPLTRSISKKFGISETDMFDHLQ